MSLTDPSEDLDRIQSVREGSSENSSSPAILECPIDDCGRIIANGRDYLMHHVRQSSDDLHEGLELDESLQVVQTDQIGSDPSERGSPNEYDPTPSIELESAEGPMRTCQSQWGPGNQSSPSSPKINPASQCDW